MITYNLSCSACHMTAETNSLLATLAIIATHDANCRGGTHVAQSPADPEAPTRRFYIPRGTFRPSTPPVPAQQPD